MNKILFFSATWCGQCRALKPKLEETVKALGIDYSYINVDSTPEDMLENYNVRSLPTLVFVNEEGKELERGNFGNFDEFINKIKQYDKSL